MDGSAAEGPGVTDAELHRLHAAGIRGARCYVLPNPFLSWDDVPAIAARVAALGRHVQVQLDGRDLPKYEALLHELPTDVVIDHNSKFLEPVLPEHPAFLTLLRLLDSGRCWVKLSARYETSKTGAPRYEDVSVLARALAKHNPERCVWATNWPHPGRNQSNAPGRATCELGPRCGAVTSQCPSVQPDRRVEVPGSADLDHVEVAG